MIRIGKIFWPRFPVKAGDFFYVQVVPCMPLVQGILVLETQQSSDTTYRVYDFDRKDDQGNLRELHLENLSMSLISVNLLTVAQSQQK